MDRLFDGCREGRGTVRSTYTANVRMSGADFKFLKVLVSNFGWILYPYYLSGPFSPIMSVYVFS